MALSQIRFIAACGLAALAGGATLATAQSEFDDIADEAEQVAAETDEALDAIEAIDPTTLGTSLVVDPSLPQPYSAQAETQALPGDLDAAVTADTETLPRGPATRMIAREQVQPVPAATSDDPFVIKSILPIEGTIRYGEWFWDESRAPASGPIVMTVDLDARVISVFRDGHEIGTAVALLGTQSHPTPLGTFPILTKERDNVSEKYNNAPMPWTLRLTWDGIAIHGSPVMNGYASHGCIGVPDPFAEKLFAIAKRGDKVVITRGKYIELGDRILS
ncbi:L,D-transpeptidase family protein [Qipengyuania nanhaisediminis]|uniref:L,D-transpeptidase family protein n=1 Tax=Qipengyuania nanhaisediminis TaxID=604088 RepID=UPI0038B2C995